MHPHRWLVPALLLLVLPGCLVAPEVSPRTRFDLAALTQYNHRGVPNVENGVVQAAGTVTLPTKDGGSLSIGAWGNVNLDDDSGDAWYPDGGAGDFTETRFLGRYGRSFGAFDVALGITNYTVSQGSEFVLGPAQGVRGGTNEVSAVVSSKDAFLGVTPRLEIHYDYDEVEGFYLRGGLARTFPIGETLSLDVDLHLGYSDSNQSEWSMGIAESGFSDLGLDARLAYPVASNVTLAAFFGASTIVDSDLADWFDILTESGLPIDSDNVWAGLGATWTW